MIVVFILVKSNFVLNVKVISIEIFFNIVVVMVVMSRVSVF